MEGGSHYKMAGVMIIRENLRLDVQLGAGHMVTGLHYLTSSAPVKVPCRHVANLCELIEISY